MYTELKDFSSSSSPPRSSTRSRPMPSIMALETSPSARDQMSTTLLYFSPWVTRPELYWSSISSTSRRASSMIRPLSSGITKSSMPMDAPAVVEWRKPRYISWSAKTTVSFRPTVRYASLMMSEIARRSIAIASPSRFGSTASNGSSGGTIWYSSARPTVVSRRTDTVFPSASRSSMRTLTLACRSTWRAAKARVASATSAKRMPVPLATLLSRVR